MASFTTLTSRLIPLVRNDIDTDQIIPARFLKVTDKNGLGENLFADWRYDGAGKPKPEFVLNHPVHQGQTVLIAGDNFGCGSSREHAPWALRAWGIQAVIAQGFADIFKSNALKNGVLPLVCDDPAFYHKLVHHTKHKPETEITIDLSEQTMRLSDGTSTTFQVDAFSKTCLLNDLDELGYILKFKPQIEAYEMSRT